MRLFKVVLGFVLSDMVAFGVFVKLFGYDSWLYPGIFVVLLWVWYLLKTIDRLTVVNLFIACVVLNIFFFYILEFEDSRRNIGGLLSVVLSVLVFWLVAHGARCRVPKVTVSAGLDEEDDSSMPLQQAVVGGMPMGLFILSVSGVLAYLVLNYMIDWNYVTGWYPLILLPVYIVVWLIPVLISHTLFNEYTMLTPEPVSFVEEYEITPERPLVALFPDTGVHIKISKDSYYHEFLVSRDKSQRNFKTHYMGSIVPLEDEMSVVLYGDDAELQLHMIYRDHLSFGVHLSFSVTGGIPDNVVYDRVKIINSNGMELRDVSILWGSSNIEPYLFDSMFVPVGNTCCAENK